MRAVRRTTRVWRTAARAMAPLRLQRRRVALPRCRRRLTATACGAVGIAGATLCRPDPRHLVHCHRDDARLRRAVAVSVPTGVDLVSSRKAPSAPSSFQPRPRCPGSPVPHARMGARSVLTRVRGATVEQRRESTRLTADHDSRAHRSAGWDLRGPCEPLPASSPMVSRSPSRLESAAVTSQREPQLVHTRCASPGRGWRVSRCRRSASVELRVAEGVGFEPTGLVAQSISSASHSSALPSLLEDASLVRRVQAPREARVERNRRWRWCRLLAVAGACTSE